MNEPARPCSLSSWTSCHGLLSRGSSTGMAAITGSGRFTCAEQYRSMAFAQLTYRESLRDIETCLSRPRIETLSHGLPPAFCTDALDEALARGVGPAAHHPGEDAVQSTKNWGWT